MAVYNKTFVNTDGTSLPTHDADWTTHSGGSTCRVVGNSCTGSATGGVISANYLNQAFNTAHYAIGTVSAGVDGTAGVTIRAQTGANSMFYAIYDGGTVFAGECIAGTPSDWDAGQTGWLPGNTVELHVDASTSTTIYLKRNGTTIQTYTGKNALSGGKAGVASFTLDGTGLSAWEGGDVGVAAPALVLPMTFQATNTKLRM